MSETSDLAHLIDLSRGGNGEAFCGLVSQMERTLRISAAAVAGSLTQVDAAVGCAVVAMRYALPDANIDSLQFLAWSRTRILAQLDLILPLAARIGTVGEDDISRLVTNAGLETLRRNGEGALAPALVIPQRLAELAPKYQQLLEQRYGQGLTLAALAVTQGMSERDLATVLCRIRIILDWNSSPQALVLIQDPTLPLALEEAISSAPGHPARTRLFSWMGKDDARLALVERHVRLHLLLTTALRAEDPARIQRLAATVVMSAASLYPSADDVRDTVATYTPTAQVTFNSPKGNERSKASSNQHRSPSDRVRVPMPLRQPTKKFSANESPPKKVSRFQPWILLAGALIFVGILASAFLPAAKPEAQERANPPDVVVAKIPTVPVVDPSVAPGSPGAPCWSPLALGSRLAVWYDAADRATLFSDSAGTIRLNNNEGAVGCWKDKSGHNRQVIQRDEALRPIAGAKSWNERPGLNFNGKQYLHGEAPASWLNNTPYSLAMVVQRHNEGGSYFIGTEADRINEGLHFGWRGDGKVVTLAQYLNDWDFPSPQGLLLGHIHLGIRGDHQTGPVSYFVDGQILGNFAGAFAYLNTSSHLLVGAGFHRDAAMIGQMTELVICTSALSPADRQSLEGYLAQKWGLWESLPAGHPGKTMTPIASSSLPAGVPPSSNSTIVSSVPAPTTLSAFRDCPPGYIRCANQSEAFQLDAHCDVAFGGEGHFYYLQNRIGSIVFNSQTFGDPNPHRPKAGYFKKK